MPNQKVKSVLKQFRARFQSDEADLPLSLRQESNEIIFRALLEDDESPMPPPTPMLGFSPESGDMGGMGGGSQQDMVQELLNASTPSNVLGPEQMAEEAPPPMPAGAPQGAPAPQQAAPGPQGGANPLEDLLGMM